MHLMTNDSCMKASIWKPLLQISQRIRGEHFGCCSFHLLSSYIFSSFLCRSVSNFVTVQMVQWQPDLSWASMSLVLRYITHSLRFCVSGVLYLQSRHSISFCGSCICYEKTHVASLPIAVLDVLSSSRPRWLTFSSGNSKIVTLRSKDFWLRSCCTRTFFHINFKRTHRV